MIKPNLDAGTLSSIDPIAVLREAGFTDDQANKFVAGDKTALLGSLDRETPTIDLRAVHKNYMPKRSIELLEWFFEKARLGEEFTAKEAEATGEDYNAMFDAVFAAARSGGFDFEVEVEDLNNSCVKVYVQGNFFIMAEVEKNRLLLYLPGERSDTKA